MSGVLLATLTTSVFAMSQECQHSLSHLKRDLSNLTNKGAECLAKNMVDVMNASIQKNPALAKELQISYAHRTVTMQMHMKRKSEKSSRITAQEKRKLIQQACAEPMQRKLIQHGIKWNIDASTPVQHIKISVSEKVCKKYGF